MSLNDKIRALISTSPLMLAALTAGCKTPETGVAIREALDDLTDNIEAVVIEELNLIDAEYQTDCAVRIKAQRALEPPPLTDAEVEFFAACLKPDPRRETHAGN